MKGRQAAIALGVFLGALGTQGLSAGDDDRAVPRGGGSSGGGHSSHGSSGGGGSSAGAQHHSSGGNSGGSSYSGSGGSSRAESARAPRTDAQRRHPQPGTGTGYRHSGRGGRYYGGGYYPYGGRYSPYNSFYWGYGYSPWYYPYYGGFYGGYYGGYGGYGGYGYGYGAPYYHRAYYDRSGSVRVLVEPRDTKVYVDGYYAGVADDYDGIFQRLNLKPGRHDIALKLEGYETLQVKLYVPLDNTLKIKHKMVRGASDRVTEQTVGDPADEARYARRPDDAEDDRSYEQDGRDDRRDDRDYESRDDRRDDSWPARAERGTLRLDVSPADASIYVDGMFRGTGQDLRKLMLPAGRHRLEVVRPGYRTVERDVEVEAGASEDVDVELPRS